MDLPCVQWQDHVAQKWTRLDPARKQCFTSLKGIDDVFQFALTHTNQGDLELLSSISKSHFIQKDPEQAASCRERGNSCFKTRDYTGAALHYSQGVCFAPQSSEQLSLCYANRSAALCHLQCYQESLHDIDRALVCGYPSHLQHKLQDRRVQCLNHLSLSQSGKPDRPEQNPGDTRGTGDGTNVKSANKSIHNGQPSSISPGVAVSFSPEKGRHLVAMERITPGQVILEDRPYGCVLIPWTEEMRKNERRTETKERVLFGTEDRHCHRCLSETLCPVPCEGCSYSRYCSTECRREAWEEHHRWECPLGAPLMALGVMSQLALRVTLKAGLKDVQSAREPVKDGDSSYKPPVTEPGTECSITGTSHDSVNIQQSSMHYGDSYPSVYHLLHHINSHSPSLRFLCAVTAAVLYMQLSRAGPPPVSWDLRGSSVTNSQPQGPEAEEESVGWSPELWLMGSVVLRHLLQLRCNAQAISMLQDTGVTNSAVQSSQEIRIATAIFPTLSLLNHSCSPNTSLAFSLGAGAPRLSHSVGSGPDVPSCPSERADGFSSSACGVTITVRASKDIAPGQEILHCYGPHSNRMAMCERRRLLQEQYCFLCTCEACVQQQDGAEEKSEGSWQGPCEQGRPGGSGGLQCGKCKGPLKKCDVQEGVKYICAQSSCGQHISSSEVSRRLQQVRKHLEKAVNLMERDRPDEALRLLQGTTVSQAALILTESHPLQGEVADAMARAHATMGDWNGAASQLERSAVAIQAQYGEDSVEMGRQLFKLAQLHFNGGALGAALSVIPRARRLLCLHCGPQCPELQELQAMEDCLQA